MQQRRSGRRWRELVASILAISAVVAVAAASPIGAAETFVVTTTSDTVDADLNDPACLDAAGECSLRAAVMQANKTLGADTITVPAGTYTLTQPSPDPAGPDASVGDLDITDDLTITGAGRDSTTISGGTGWSDRLLEIPGGVGGNVEVALSGIALTNGKTSSPGGALYFADVTGTLSLTEMRIASSAAGPSAAGEGGGAYVRAKAFTIRDVGFEGNTAGGAGGGLHIQASTDASTTHADGLTLRANSAGSNGGGLATTGDVPIEASDLVVENNRAATSANGAGGGLYLNADAKLDDVTITGNSSTAGGGGIQTARRSRSTAARSPTTRQGQPHPEEG